MKAVATRIQAGILVLSLAGMAGCASSWSSPDTSAYAPPGSSYGSSPTLENARARSKAKKGAVAGALLGGLWTAMMGGGRDDMLRNAAYGAAAGAIAGYSVGRHQDRLLAGRDEAARDVGYTPGQGNYLRMKSLSNTSALVSPGQTLTLRGVYVVLPANEYTRPTLRYYEGISDADSGDLLFKNGPTEETAALGGGRVQTDFSIEFPSDAVAGSYTATLGARFEDVYDETTASLTVVARNDLKGPRGEPVFEVAWGPVAGR